MYKKGQFFLIAALIAAGLLFGLTAVVNSVQTTTEDKAFYSLSNEIDFETKRVLDYGTFYEEDTQALVNSFLTNYADYISQEKVIFLFGNRDHLNSLYFTERNIDAIGISTGAGAQTTTIPRIDNSPLGTVSVIDNNVARVMIGDIPYDFALREGQNFFFVIIKEDNHEAFVATN